MEIPYLKGESKIVYKPAPEQASGEWFINDHCFIIDKKGTLHFFGINDPFPSADKDLYRLHPYIGHAISTDPFGKWSRCPFVLDDSGGEQYLGAPFVVWLEEKQHYVMLFEAKLDGRRVLESAFSADLYNWKRTSHTVLLNLPEVTRDPCILSINGRFHIYLCTPSPRGSTVTVTETSDFETFKNTRVCLAVPDGITYGGIESPFVYYRNGFYYLFFTYAHRHYYETPVVVSERYDLFSMDSVLTTLYGHAAEILCYKNKTYISSCGPEDKQIINTHGLYLARLEWMVKPGV